MWRELIGEISRSPAVRIRERRRNLNESLLEKSRLAQHAFEEDHCMGWNKVKILQKLQQIKHKHAAHVACSTDPISQTSLEVSPIWIPPVRKEVNR
jgi:poly(A) polymerase Pap1